MAASKAKKKRMHLERTTGYNPEFKRGDWNGVNPVEKKTPTITEKVRRSENKHKKRWDRSKDYRDGPINFLHKVC